MAQSKQSTSWIHGSHCKQGWFIPQKGNQTQCSTDPQYWELLLKKVSIKRCSHKVDQHKWVEIIFHYFSTFWQSKKLKIFPQFSGLHVLYFKTTEDLLTLHNCRDNHGISELFGLKGTLNIIKFQPPATGKLCWLFRVTFQVPWKSCLPKYSRLVFMLLYAPWYLNALFLFFLKEFEDCDLKELSFLSKWLSHFF